MIVMATSREENGEFCITTGPTTGTDGSKVKELDVN